jgi:hypothetical protein
MDSYSVSSSYNSMESELIISTALDCFLIGKPSALVIQNYSFFEWMETYYLDIIIVLYPHYLFYLF